MDTLPAILTAAAAAAASSVQQLRLLIVDDDPDQRMLAREVLEDRFGTGTCTEAATGAEALALDLCAFDLILSDYNLPDTNGMALLGAIRARCPTPVIMVTGENVIEFAAEAIRRGAVDYVVKTGEYVFTLPLVVEKNLAVLKLMRENDGLRRELEAALAGVRSANDQLSESLRRVEELAATDALTGLFNRRQFNLLLARSFAESERYGTELSCVMLDLDEYKQLNDSQGHQKGDEVLQLVGRTLRATLRASDLAARYGGDEFVLLLPQVDAAEAGRLANRVRDLYRAGTAELLGRARGMSMSVGIASVSANAPATAEALVALTDEALYASKQGGRDRVTLAHKRAERKAA